MSFLKYDGSLAVETAQPVTGFYGSSAVETMTGTSAADALWGGASDVLTGGSGDDTYYLQGAGIGVNEAAGGGVDKLVGWANLNLANYANIENLEVGGDHTYAAGDARDNIIVATGTNQELYGGGGQDVLVGSATSPDTFIVIKGEGNDAIYNFKPGQDVVRLTSDYVSFDQVQSHLTQAGADVKLDLGGGDAVVIRNVATSQLTAANFELQLNTAKLGAVTFHDEFSGPLSLYNATYNPTGVWRPDYDLAGPQGANTYTLTSNGEQQIYTSPYFRDHAGDFAESPFVSNSDGTLSIIAKPSSNPEIFGYHYTSGMLSSLNSFAQTYGYFEMRAELPDTAGGWPAFWLLPEDRSWPPELDVMETLTKDQNAAWTTVHTAQTGSHTMSQGSEFIPGTTDGFHTYGVLWTRTDLVWYVDGVEVYHAATPADMNKPMYMIANLALGGWGGDVDSSQMPAEMKVDYIRAYGLADGSSTVALDTAHTGGTSVPAGGASSSSGGASTASGATGASGGISGGVTPAIGPQVLTATAIRAVLTGGAYADTLNASDALDTLTGGAGADHFVFANEPWAPAVIADFHLGEDVLDLSALLQKAGYTGSNPVADQYVSFESDGNGGTMVGFDHDGPTGSSPVWPNRIIDLQNVSPTGLTWAALQGGSTGSGTSAPSGGGVVSSGGGGGGGGGGSPIVTAPEGKVLDAPAGGAALDGGGGADTIRGADDGPNYIRGFEGDDNISGGRGYNQINGNLGNDNITGRSAVGDDLMGGQGADTLTTTASTAHNSLNGNKGDDSIVGSAFGDTLHGGQGDDRIIGGAGRDWISGDLGHDTLTGGAGGDIFHHFAGAGVSTVTDFHYAEGDRVQLDPGTGYLVSQVGADVVIDVTGGGQMILQNVQQGSLPTGWLFE